MMGTESFPRMIRDPATTDLTSPGRLEQLPARWSGTRGGTLALTDARGEWTWRELEHGRKQLAELLLTLGVRAGDRVMVVGENCASMVALLFAIFSVGAWVVNVNARLAPREIDAIRAHATPRRVLYLGDDSPDARHHAERVQATRLSLGRWGTINVTPLDERCLPEPVVGNPVKDVAALLYTSGTTGEPKAVMLTHANLLFIARVSAELRRITPDDRVYGLLPLAHVYGLASVCLGTLRAGASLHLQARFTPAAMAECLATRGITVCQGVPTMYAKLLEHLKSRSAAFAAPALRYIQSGGAPLGPALKREVEAFFGLPLCNGYGLSEASPTLTQTLGEAARNDCSVGQALPGVELRIVDAEGKDVAPGEPGELWARGPNIMKGYYRDPQATAATMRPEGWLATGDIARRGPDGAYFIEGRVKELIIRSGFNVYPAEVEAVLNAHPEVMQSAVVGRRGAGEDEAVVAFVELAAGARVTPAELLAFAAASLAPYKRPCEVIVVPALPAAANGKVLKARLAQIAIGNAPGRVT
jgi:long-chain acyl-CoA synthetase